MTKETLLQLAKKIETQKRTYTKIEGMEELALAWVRGEINITQIARVLNYPNTGYRVYAKIALALKDYLTTKVTHAANEPICNKNGTGSYCSKCGDIAFCPENKI